VIALDARIRVAADAGGGGADRFAIRPYPDALEERVAWQGREIVVRPIRPDDETQHRAFIEKLAPEDIRLRVFQYRRELSRAELARLTQVDYEREMAFVATAPGPDGTSETLGVVRAITDPDNADAEFAIIVRSDLHGRGLGHLLLDKVVRYCRERGTERLVGLVLPENLKMLELARTLGFELDDTTSDRDALRVVMSLAAARTAR